MSIYLRVRDASGTWGAPLFSKHGGPARLVYNVYAAEPSSGMLFNAEMGTTQNSKVLEARTPADLVDPAAWHDLIVVCDGAKMRLFVDGQWHDEDFVMGTLRQNNPVDCLIGGEVDADGKVKGGLQGLIDHVAVWKRALSAKEIETLSGGAEEVAARADKLNDKLQTPMQYYRPHHPDWNVGDCLPFYHDGTFHFYYLGDKRHHGSKNHLGAHQWAHISTRDLKHWRFHDFAVPITEQWEGSICTGSMFWHDGTYYAFYATRRSDNRAEYLSMATSPDGINFTKQKPNPFAGPEPPYIVGPFRDPTVFRDPGTSKFHMLVTACLKDPTFHRRGDTLAHLTSSDLRTWKQHTPFIEPELTGAPECPDHFLWNGWYYVIFSNQGTARYRMARSPLGPWMRPRVDTFGGPTEYVMKTAPFGPKRRIGVAWIGKNGWAGNAVFREIVQAKDGTLSTKLPEELTPPTKEALTPKFEALTDGAKGDGKQVQIESPQGMSAGFFAGVPQNVRITLRVVPGKQNNGWFGLCTHATGNYVTGTEIRCTPNLNKVELRDALAGPRTNNEWQSIEDVEGMDRPFTLEVILKEDMIDICVDNCRTMMCRVNELKGDRLFFFAQDSDVKFEQIDIQPLK
ncbi:MAG: family 43 glycosylhydrolase [Planctomycetes bacterium]|nr:family 43 glycosylhydrolase [Planctomycetota bacterium]